MMYEELCAEGTTAALALERLDRIIRLLRSDKGCPWDREQTHESLKPCLVEETYEAIEAIDNGDWDNLEEELGDVLLQVIFHGQLGEESGGFDLRSIINRECDKMIGRHPHVFSNNHIETIDSVLEKWENMKRKEKEESWVEALERVPKAMPALRRSFKLQKKAAEAGFDWDDASDAFKKIDEETRELLDIHEAGDLARTKEELGDILFAVVNVARFLRVDPEEALNVSSQKFIRRFGLVEKYARNEGRELQEMTLAEMDRLWEEAKKQE